MNFTLDRFFLLLVMAAALAWILSAAAQPPPAVDAHQRYLYDRADCLSGRSAEDKATCLREAGAAQAEARKGRLADASSDFEHNRIARCAYLTGPDREYCVRRMHGEGTTSGSVEGGGILRELVVTVPD
jgi:hypothetical protein